MSKATICHIGPVSIHSYRLLEALSHGDYKLSLISDSRAWIAPEVSRSIPVFVLPSLTQANFAERFVSNSIQAIKILRRIRPDLVHLHAQHQYCMAVALSQSSFILNSWGMEVLGLPASSFPRRELAKRTALKARKVIVDAGILRDIWIKIGVPSRKIEVIPFGVDINMFNPSVNGGNVRRNLGIRKDDFAIISTRPFYNSHYNIECLIESIPTVVVRHSNARFIIKGSGPREQYLRRLVERLGVSKYVRFVGIVPHFEVARYLRAADIYVSTSFIDSTSVSLLEAMACGVAPVVTNIPGNREWIRDEVNGLLYPPRDPMALAGRISRLIENEDQRREFGERCSMIIERKANWKECVRKVEAIYEELLQ